jgi:biopolymer transport protein TolR
MAMATGGKTGLSASINLTPLIDVLLVLIIIFMVLPSPKQAGEEALIPRPPVTPQPVTRVRTLVVQLLSSPGPGSRPELKINGEDVSWAGLRGRLQEVLKIRAERVVFVKADPGIDYEYVAEVVDIGRAAGADRVGLMPGDIETR